MARWILACALGAALITGCVSNAPFTWVHDVPPEVLTAVALPIEPRDRLYVFVREQPTMSGEVVVADDGTVVLPVVGQIVVSGATLEKVAALVVERLQGVLQRPDVRVSLIARHPATITVVGEVREPGEYDVRPPARVLDALARAGGLTEFAHRRAIYVVRRGAQPMRVRFRYHELARGEVSSSTFVLLDGDAVVVE